MASRVEISKDGAFYRLAVSPPEALRGVSRPSTYSSHALAAMSAKLIADASGIPIVDLTIGRNSS